MLQILFNEAIKKAGSQQALTKRLGITQQRVSEFKNYKDTERKPSDTMIAELAIYIGMNPLEAVLMSKAETEGKAC